MTLQTLGLSIGWDESSRTLRSSVWPTVVEANSRKVAALRAILRGALTRTVWDTISDLRAGATATLRSRQRSRV